MSVLKLRRALPSAICAGALFLSVGTAGAAGPKATVKPAKNLTNGKVVTVKFSGFNAKKDKIIAIVQCTTKVEKLGEAACDTADVQLVSPGTKSGTVQLTVRTGKIGTKGGKCGTTAANADKCLVAVTGLDKKLNPVPDQNATVPISFKV